MAPMEPFVVKPLSCPCEERVTRGTSRSVLLTTRLPQWYCCCAISVGNGRVAEPKTCGFWQVYSMWLHPPKTSPNPLLYLGFVLAAAGGGLVLYFKPSS